MLLIVQRCSYQRGIRGNIFRNRHNPGIRYAQACKRIYEEFAASSDDFVLRVDCGLKYAM